MCALLALVATTATLSLSLRDRWRLQANQVSVHLSQVPTLRLSQFAVTVQLYNLSGLPVKAVVLRLVHAGKEIGGSFFLASLAPETTGAPHGPVDEHFTRVIQELVRGGRHNIGTLEVAIRFTDARGKRWRRDHTGRLKRSRYEVDVLRRVLRARDGDAAPLSSAPNPTEKETSA